MDYLHSKSGCFESFRSRLIRKVKTNYFGLACKLRGEGRLLNIWFDLVKVLINHGKVAVVSYGKYLLFAQIVDGYLTQTGKWANLKVLLMGDAKGREFSPREGAYVVFQWGDGEPFNLSEYEHDISEMWQLKGLISWDQDKSKKRIDVEFERNPGKDGWKDVYNSYEAGFLGIISPKNNTNQVKKWGYFESKNNVERQQLWKDLREVESKFYFDLGIRHNPFAKEERQNNPEVTSGQSWFDAWEIDHQEGIVKGILEFQKKPWGGGEYQLQFGSLPILQIENGTTQLLSQMKYQNPPFLANNDKKRIEHQ